MARPAQAAGLLVWVGWPFVSFLLIAGWIAYLVCKSYERWTTSGTR